MSFLLRALFNGTSKHRKLSEEWASIREPVVEGVTFYCKYLGSTMVDDPKGEAATAEAIKRIIHAAKQKGRKPERVSIHVSLKGIRMADSSSSDVLLETSIYKISYCSADAHYDHVFAFIATNDDDTCECHAFLCSKRKMAQAATISIAQAFNLAYEYWKMAMESKNGDIYADEELPAEVKVREGTQQVTGQVHSQPSSQTSSPIPIRSDFGSTDLSTSGYQSSNQALLIDLEEPEEAVTTTNTTTTNTTSKETNVTPLNKQKWDDFSEFSEGFSRLALRHTDRVLPGTCPSGWDGIGDLAAFTAPPPASPTASGSWPWSSPPHSPSSGPSDPWTIGQSAQSHWTIGQSPPSHWEDFSGSPNSAFLHSCQSPPTRSSHFPESFAQESFAQESFTQESFTQEGSQVNNPFKARTENPSGSSHDPFMPGVLEGNQGPHSPSCGVRQSPWGGDIFDGRKNSNVMCS